MSEAKKMKKIFIIKKSDPGLTSVKQIEVPEGGKFEHPVYKEISPEEMKKKRGE
jgi:hypothetical protein